MLIMGIPLKTNVVEEIKLRPYQKDLVNDIRASWKKGNKYVIMQLPTGGGKCLGVNTPVLMYDGTIKMVQNIKVGDMIMGDDSTPRKILSTCTGKETLYRITPIKGDSWVCNESHILSLISNHNISKSIRKNNIYDIPIKDYISMPNSSKWVLKQYRVPVKFKPSRTEIDPYLLGMWLAEGRKNNGSPVLFICSKDIDILDYLSKYNPSVIDDNERGTCKRVSLGQPKTGCKPNKYRNEFRKCIDDKKNVFIPNEYKINSRNKRLRLLAGLLDGDGYLGNNLFEICTKFKTLYIDIFFLARSLGFAAYMHIKVVNGVDYYRIIISGNIEEIPNILKRKKAYKRKQIKDVLHVGFKVNCIGTGCYYGFEIDGNHRFLLGDFTVTHNTVCFSYMAQKAALKGNKVLILTHRQELMGQTSGTLTNFHLNPKLIDAKTRKIPVSNCYVCMTNSLRNRLKKEEWKKWFDSISLVIIDEAQQQDFNWIFDIHDIKEKYIIGATATPKRSNSQTELACQYEDIVYGPDVQEMINMGYLCTDKYFSVPVDMKGVNIKGGEYDSEQMYSRYNKSELYAGVVDNWKRLCDGTITLCFCVNIQHCINTCKAFNDAGIKAKFIVSELSKPKLKSNSKGDLSLFMLKKNEYENYLCNFATSSGDRKEVIEEWERGDFKVLINAGIATTGFDFPPIQTIIMNRSTTSDNLLLQIFGRGARISEGKEYFNILDFGDNCSRLGYYRQQREYSLYHDEKKSGGGVPAVKECKKCHALVFASSRICKYCGYVFPETHEEKVIKLTEIQYKEAVTKLETISDYEIFAKGKGYKKAWLWRQIYIKFGLEGLKTYCKDHNLSPRWPYMMQMKYNAQGLRK